MADQPNNPTPPPDKPAPAPTAPRGRLGRLRARASQPLPRPKSNRGLFILVVTVGGIATVMAIGGFVSLKYSETASFCSKCHTMKPELKAYKLGVHRDVPCAECHVAPGLKGWVKAKINGSKQTIQVITGKFPKPIPAPNHSMLPKAEDTCMECHSLEDISKNGGPMKVILQPSYLADKKSTRQTVAVVVRPPALGSSTNTRSAHWHVEQEVDFTSSDEHRQKIDWIGVKYENGRKKEFIARSKANVSSNVKRDIARLKKDGETTRMDCIECHNRIGHDVPAPDRAVDDAIDEGKISRKLPYIKRNSVEVVGANYPSDRAAEDAIGDLEDEYVAKYPLIAKNHKERITKSMDELKVIYKLVATPEMKTMASTYPSNLGHKSAPGCFRCHDGAHFQVVKGRVINKTIPWACTTCHTFPQIGKKVDSVSLLGEPADHKARLWGFKHKVKVASTNPAGTSCAQCHRRSYCANCHASGAAKVSHDEMLYQHPTAAEKSGLQACSYCHQATSCARCHKGPILKSKKFYSHTSPAQR